MRKCPPPTEPRPAPEHLGEGQVEGNLARKPLPEDSLDRRRSPRRSESATGWLANASGSTITNGRTVAISDLSLHGVGFTSPRACRVGDAHWIIIARGHLRLSTRVRIISNRQREDGEGWDVGGEFF